MVYTTYVVVVVVTRRIHKVLHGTQEEPVIHDRGRTAPSPSTAEVLWHVWWEMLGHSE